MVFHIVIFKLIQNNDDAIDFIKRELLSLKKLPEVLGLDIVEKDAVIKNDIEGDIVLFSQFKNRKDLQSYMEAPIHLEVIKNTSGNIEKKHILDFNSTVFDNFINQKLIKDTTL
ncbi:Dabb family protein [Aquimarina algicola]|uniref:Stress-response A/B barrel domain-containing protein n=1 Tax=Aquimarina algicola TaxID=2589995 RepID=A0A504J996_9FLAO|nr:Dabb family protein [Aquimarina algicola]TPN87486.1 hypothetical protein FHK87_07850 [Aquimarina algicola]